MKIILFTSVYYNNIGNGFIDLGAEATLKAAMPDNAKIIKLSQCANFAASMDWKFQLKENVPFINWMWTRVMQKFAKRLHDKSYSTVQQRNVFSAAEIALADYFIIPGCVLTVPFFKIFGGLLVEKAAQGCKIIFLGASGNHYTKEEISFVRSWLSRISPYAIMTRDSVAYENYKDLSKLVYNGIDNVFFVNRINIPTFDTSIGKYDVINFDLPKHRAIKNRLVAEKEGKKNIVFTNHKPYPYTKVSSEVKKGVLISDYPLDYLAIYRNVETTYSDRVHACIPTLSFGNKAQLFSDSPRKALFENVGIKDLTSKPIRIEGLKELQDSQINFLKQILTD